MESILDSEQAAQLLGIQRATLYVYVSRGLLEPVRVAHNGKSYFRLEDLEQFAWRRRKKQLVTPTLPAIMTSITTLGNRGPVYRGIPADVLIGVQRFEAVAELLWHSEQRAWDRSVCPDVVHQTPQSAIITPIASAVAEDPSIGNADPDLVTGFARKLIVASAQSIAQHQGSETSPISESVSEIFATAFASDIDAARVRRAIEGVLIVFADHELSPSTLVVRVAASEGSGIANAFLVGLGVLSGYLYYSIADSQALLAHAFDIGATKAIRAQVKTRQSIPGFGHKRNYHKRATTADPRVDIMMKGILPMLSPDQRSVVNELVAAADAAGAGHPSIHFASAILGHIGNVPSGLMANILLVARMAGWTAHYLEESEVTPRRFRITPTYLTTTSEV